MFLSQFYDEYINNLSEEALNSQLDYFCTNPVPLEELKPFSEKLFFIHGEKDSIINEKEAMDLVGKFQEAKLCKIDAAGHAPFLNQNFKTLITEEVENG